MCWYNRNNELSKRLADFFETSNDEIQIDSVIKIAYIRGYNDRRSSVYNYKHWKSLKPDKKVKWINSIEKRGGGEGRALLGDSVSLFDFLQQTL